MITKDMTISSILQLDPGAAAIFMSYGLYCLTCPSASGESLETACRVHSIDPEPVLTSLNLYFDRPNAGKT
jgi:hybrid cluster-associated redox disulfide protein